MRRIRAKLTASFGDDSYEQIRTFVFNDVPDERIEMRLQNAAQDAAADWAAEMVESDYEILSEETV